MYFPVLTNVRNVDSIYSREEAVPPGATNIKSTRGHAEEIPFGQVRQDTPLTDSSI